MKRWVTCYNMVVALHQRVYSLVPRVRATFAWCHIRHYIKTLYHRFSNCKEWKWNRPLTRLIFIPLRVKNSLGHTFTMYTHTYTSAGQDHQEICNSKHCWSSCHSRSVRSLGLRRWVTTYQSHSQFSFPVLIPSSHCQFSFPVLIALITFSVLILLILTMWRDFMELLSFIYIMWVNRRVSRKVLLEI